MNSEKPHLGVENKLGEVDVIVRREEQIEVLERLCEEERLLCVVEVCRRASHVTNAAEYTQTDQKNERADIITDLPTSTRTQAHAQAHKHAHTSTRKHTHTHTYIPETILNATGVINGSGDLPAIVAVLVFVRGAPQHKEALHRLRPQNVVGRCRAHRCALEVHTLG